MEKKKSEIPIQENYNNEDPTTWALPDGAIARLGRGCEPNMAFSPDNKLLASVGKDGSILLWDLSPFIDN